jgi:hypothetical protein
MIPQHMSEKQLQPNLTGPGEISKFKPEIQNGPLGLEFNVPCKEQFSMRSLHVDSEENSLRGSEMLHPKKKKKHKSSTKSRKRKEKIVPVVTMMQPNTNPARSKSKRKLKISNSSTALPYRVTRTS